MTIAVDGFTQTQAVPALSAFACGNRALRQGDYQKAIESYLKAPFEQQALGPVIAFNAALARRARRRNQIASGLIKVGVCACELSEDSSSRAVGLAQLYGSFADVALLGFVFAKAGQAAFARGVESAAMPCHALRVPDLARFWPAALEFVLANPYEIVHISKPRAPNILLAGIYQLIWDTRVLVDVDADELVNLREPRPVTLDGYLERRKSLPDLDKINGEDWTRLAFGLRDDFDGVTVASTDLREKFGGTVLANDAKARRESLSRLRRQAADLMKHSGASCAQTLRLLGKLPPAGTVRTFGLLVDIQNTRLKTAPLPLTPVAVRSGLGPAPDSQVRHQVMAPVTPSRLPGVQAIPRPEIEWVRASELRASEESGPLILLGDTPLGTGQRTMRPESWSALRAFCGLHGMQLSHALRVKGLNGAEQVPVAAAVTEMRDLGIGDLERFPALLGDAWFKSDTSLRMRFDAESHVVGVVRMYQLELGSRAVRLAGEILVSGDAPVFADIALSNPFSPLLMVASSLAGAIRAAALLPFPSLCRGGWHHGELAAIGSKPDYVPNLLASSAELLAEYLDSGESGHGLSIGRIIVDLSGAIGAEKMFSPLIQEWLREVLALGKVGFTGAASHEDPGARAYLQGALTEYARQCADVPSPRVAAREAATCVLHLPADSLPSISALVSRSLRTSGAVVIGSYVLAHPVTGKPQSVVSLPPMGSRLLELQSRALPVPFPVVRRLQGGDSLAEMPPIDERAGIPLALSFREPTKDSPARLLVPLAPEQEGPLRRSLTDAERQAASVSAVIVLRSFDDAFEGLLQTLASQTLARALDLVVAAAGLSEVEQRAVTGVLAQYFPDRHVVVEVAPGHAGAALNEAVRRARGRRLLIADPACALHDPRVLETLYVLGLDERVGTSSCLLLREVSLKKGTEVQFHSGGLYPSQISLLGSLQWTFSEPYTLGAFPAGTYPVMGNSFHLALVNPAAWTELDGADATSYAHGRPDLDFCLRASLAGYEHLCTTAVSASCLRVGAPHGANAHVSRHLRPEHWHELLSRATLMTECH